jgi:hypothetical protein
MSRRVIFGCALLIVVACGSPPIEQQLLTQFFRAARVRDNTTLAGMSAVNFDPRTDGSVEDFKIDSIGASQTRKLQVQEFTEEQDKIRADQVEFTKKMRDFYQSNSLTIDRVMKADQAGQPVRGKTRSCWPNGRSGIPTAAIWNASCRRHGRRSRRKKSFAVASLTPPGRDSVDVTGMDVDIVSEPVTVTAQVQTPDGKTAPRRWW